MDADFFLCNFTNKKRETNDAKLVNIRKTGYRAIELRRERWHISNYRVT